MVKALFDTNILIDFLQGRLEAQQELERYDDGAISVVTWMEIMVGASPERQDETRSFLAGFHLIAFDHDQAERAVALRRQHRMKLPDAMVWAAAQIDQRLLVSRNIRDFPADDPDVRIPYDGG